MFYICKNTLPLQFESFDSFVKVEELWNRFLPENHHLISPDVMATEASHPDDLEFRYVNIKSEGKLIGVMYLQCLNFNRKHYNHEIFERPFLKHLKDIIVKQSVNVMICGNLFRVNFQGFYFEDKANKELIFDCLQLYRQEFKANSSYYGILLKDCSREFSPTQISCYSYKAFKQDLTMELRIRKEWVSFEDYKSSLSRKYKQRVNKILQSALSIERIEMGEDQLKQYEGRISDLYLNIVNKQSIALGILNAAYFLQMKKYLGERFKVFGYFKGDELLAFSSHIYYPVKNSMEIHYIGLDYARNQEFNLYFNILYDGIVAAIEGRFKLIEMGRTAREAKANAGAQPVENFNYVWIKPGLIRIVFKFIGTWFESNIGEDWKKRNPFRSNSETVALSPIVQN